MLNAVLSTVMANPGFLGLGALVVSTFFAGTMLQGERVRNQEIRDELREIKQLTEQSLLRVAAIEEALHTEDARLVNEIGVAYEALAVLNEKERVQRAALEATARRNRQLAIERLRQRETVKKSDGFIIDN